MPLLEVVASATNIQARMPEHNTANYNAANRTNSGCDGTHTEVSNVLTKRAASDNVAAATLNLPGTVLGLDIPTLLAQ